VKVLRNLLLLAGCAAGILAAGWAALPVPQAGTVALGRLALAEETAAFPDDGPDIISKEAKDKRCFIYVKEVGVQEMREKCVTDLVTLGHNDRVPPVKTLTR
jgi:hypothetical protein